MGDWVIENLKKAISIEYKPHRYDLNATIIVRYWGEIIKTLVIKDRDNDQNGGW